MENKKNILILSAGTGNAFATCKAINDKFKDKLNLIIMDVNPKHLVSACIYCDQFIQSILITDSQYYDFLKSVIVKNNIAVCIPFIDFDVSTLAEIYSKDDGKLKGLNIQVKDINVANICLDKLATYHWLKSNSIQTPNTYSIGGFFNESEMIIKPRKGIGSQITELSHENLRSIKDSDDYLVQEKCKYPEITIDVFRNENEFYYLCRERIETKSGVCTKARLFLDNELGSIALKISNQLDLRYFCFQVMKLNGNWAVTDINPRYGSGTSMSQPVGIDFFGAMLSDFLGLSPLDHLEPFKGEVYITRQYNNILSLHE